jgi:hypothetical protein
VELVAICGVFLDHLHDALAIGLDGGLRHDILAIIPEDDDALPQRKLTAFARKRARSDVPPETLAFGYRRARPFCGRCCVLARGAAREN